MFLWLIGCIGRVWTDQGAEPLHAALMMPYGEQKLVALANSYASCASTETDNPHTQADEAAIGAAWWAGELRTALSREGALIVILMLPGPGDWQIGTEASAAWYRVDEAMMLGQNGMIATYTPTEITLDTDVSEGSIQLDESGEGEFQLLNGPEGNFKAESCDNPLLLSLVTTAIINFAVAFED